RDHVLERPYPGDVPGPHRRRGRRRCSRRAHPRPDDGQCARPDGRSGMSAPQVALPRWIDIGLLPIINLVQALIVAGLVVMVIGVNPFEAMRIMAWGAVYDSVAISYTLYYATDFVFTGLAVAVAFHAGLFNIGGEGQAYVGGLGVGLVVLALDRVLPPMLLLPLAILAGALFGALWAAVPAWLQAWRGSHIVITTIMFNFVAAALMVYLMVNWLIAPGSMAPETRRFAAGVKLPAMHEMLGAIGITVVPTALNLSLLLALACCGLVWIFIWHTAWGYALRTLGHNPDAAAYAGIDLRRNTMIAMCLSGALAGLVAVNEILGVHQRL